MTGRYAAIACSVCGTVQAADQKNRTHRCRACSKVIHVPTRRVYASAGTPAEIQKIISVIKIRGLSAVTGGAR